MNIDFKGFMENTVTFQCDENLKAGALVKITANGTVAPCEEGDKICGVCLSVREGYAAVQVSGFVNVSVNSELALGFVGVAADAYGKVKADTQGREVLCICSDAETAGIIL